MNDKFFQLLRLAIGVSDDIPKIEPSDWPVLYKISKKQLLTALVFDGVRRIGKDANIDEDLLLKWMGDSFLTEKRNLRVNAAISTVSDWFGNKGYRTCILKGQGNALMYPNPLHRTAGDIDIWVLGKPRDIIRFVHKVVPKAKASYHHIDFPAVDGIPVEVHYRPCYMQSLLHNHQLQKYFLQNAEEQFSHQAEIDGKKVAVPTASFNVVFQLVHIYNHLFQEGIGLRQLIDYYFNFERLKNGNIEILQRDLKHLGLWKFAGAVMYVLHEVLGLDESKMIAPMDAERGKLLLEDILAGGNFGRHDKRNKYKKGTMGHNVQRLCRDWRLVRYYPAEALSEPLFRMHHYLWRMMH